MDFTSREPFVDFVQGAFLEILINSEQKITANYLLEGKDVFEVMPTGFGKI